MGTDRREQIRGFLTTRRARITPEQAGLPSFGERRVPGLRREEVAMLADVSVDYYTRLERGNASGVSDNVLGAIARALRLDAAERAHLFDLVRASNARRDMVRHGGLARVRPGVQRVLDTMTTAAYVRNGHLDILALNSLGRAVFAPVVESADGPVNLARFTFLEPAARGFFRNWELIAADYVALLRAEAGRAPHGAEIGRLIGELWASEGFRALWAAHDVRFSCSGVKELRHPLVGDMTLPYEALDVANEPGLRLNVYTAAPGSPSQDALDLLASWSATSPGRAVRPTDIPHT